MKSFPEGFSHMRNKQFLHFFLDNLKIKTPQKLKGKKDLRIYIFLLLIATKIWSVKKKGKNKLE